MIFQLRKLLSHSDERMIVYVRCTAKGWRRRGHSV